MNAFLEENSRLNLISKNDEKYLWEKHVFDSLSICLVFEKFGFPSNLLDIGTGGGFPSVPVAFKYPKIEVFALDSIRKKINAVENLKLQLDLKNLHPICDRAENLNQEFELIVSRAVATLGVIAAYAAPLLVKDGLFVAYKSKKAEEEISEAEPCLQKFGMRVVDIIEYSLPLKDNYRRNLIVLQKFK